MQPEQKPATSRVLPKHLQPIETGPVKQHSRTQSIGSDVSTPVTATSSSNSNAAAQIILAKGISNYSELIECKNDLERNDLLLNLAPPDMAPALTKRSEIYHQTVSQKQQEVDAKMDDLGIQLNSTEFWSFPIISKRREKRIEPIMKRLDSFKDQLGKLEQSAKLVEEKRRKRAEKSERLKRELLQTSNYQDFMGRITNLEARLREMGPRMDDEEDELECNINYQTNLVAESTKSYPNLREMEYAVKSLTDSTVELRKMALSCTDLRPALNIQSEDHSNVQSRLLSLMDEKQPAFDEQIRQFSQSFNQYCIEFENADPVAEALMTFKADIDSDIDKCIDEQMSQLDRALQKSVDINQQRLHDRMGSVAKKTSLLFGELMAPDSSKV